MGLFNFGKKKEQSVSSIPELDLPPLPPIDNLSLEAPAPVEIPPLDLPKMDSQMSFPSFPPVSPAQNTELPSLDNLDFDLSLPDINEEPKTPVQKEAPVAETKELPPAPEFTEDKFLKVNRFKEMIAVTHTARTEVDECISIGSAINSVQEHEMKALEKFQNEVLHLHRKISNIDRMIFER